VAEISRGSPASDASRPFYLALATAPISRAISAWMRALLSMLMWETVESSATSTFDSLLHGDGQITQEEMKALMILCGGREVTRVPTAISKKPRAGLASVTVANPPL
jgi:hypothetical protein